MDKPRKHMKKIVKGYLIVGVLFLLFFLITQIYLKVGVSSKYESIDSIDSLVECLEKEDDIQLVKSSMGNDKYQIDLYFDATLTDNRRSQVLNIIRKIFRKDEVYPFFTEKDIYLNYYKDNVFEIGYIYNYGALRESYNSKSLFDIREIGW